MAALRRRTGGRIRFAGVGGPSMAREGLESLYPLSDLAVMGLVEILPHLPRLIRRLRETASDIRARRPDLVVTVDSTDFSIRLARRIRGAGIPVVHYVAPQLWAWLPGRGRKLAGLFDHIMALLPFEPEFFAGFEVPCTYVGHPVLESGADRGNGAAFRAAHGIGPETTLVSVLPGSRHTEVERLLSVFGGALALVADARPDVTAVISTVATVRDAVEAATKDWQCPTIVVTDAEHKHDAFAASRAALTKSGTITLELALARLPMVVCYRLSRFSAFLARRLIDVGNIALVNLLAGRQVAPELLQDDCVPERISAEVLALLEDDARCEAQRRGLALAVEHLGDATPPPSERAASFLLDLLERRRAGGDLRPRLATP